MQTCLVSGHGVCGAAGRTSHGNHLKWVTKETSGDTNSIISTLSNKMHGRGLPSGGRKSAWQFSSTKTSWKHDEKEGTKNLISSNWVDPRKNNMPPDTVTAAMYTCHCMLLRIFPLGGTKLHFLPVCRHPQRHSQLQHHQDPGKFDTFNRRWLSSNTKTHHVLGTSIQQ